MIKLSLIVLIASAGAVSVVACAAAAGTDTLRVYVGTYTRGESDGIYALDLDLQSGALMPRGLVARAENPSFLAIHPSGGYLYAVNEVGDLDERGSGGVSAFRIDSASGELAFLNQQLSHGGGPCFLIIDDTGENVFVANYGGGSVAVLPTADDGQLKPASDVVQHEGSGPNPDRQEGPHAHSINLDRTGRFALAADLGLDKVLVYRVDAEEGTLTPNDPAYAIVDGGSGPRHLSFTPDGRFAYVVNELSLTVSAFAFDDETGTLAPLQTISTLPGAPESSYSTADIQVHPSGKFLYASNRGHDSIAVFAIDSETGRLAAVEYEPTQGRTPRSFRIDPTGRYLLAANQNSNTVVVFEIDPQTGALSPTGYQAAVPTPVCLRFARVAGR